MDRETIEANDQRLIKHFRTLVEQNEKKAPVKSSMRPVILLGALVLIAMIAGGSYVFWSSKTPVPDVQKPQTPVLTDTKPDTPDVPPSETIVMETAGEQVRESLSTPDVIEETVAGNPVDEVPSVEPETRPTLTVSELVTCSQVANRQYTRVKSVFSLKDKIKPVVWMTVKTETLPRTLTHVYYINGQKYCEVPLAIRFPRTRTWSHVTIDSEKHLGPWLVDVVDENGRVLNQVEFEVVP